MKHFQTNAPFADGSHRPAAIPGDVCPECGNDSFERRVVTHVEQTGNIVNGEFEQYDEHVISSEDDSDVIQCVDCRTEFDASCDELVTEEAYNESENA